MSETYEGWIVRVVNCDGVDCWLGRRVYRSYQSALTVKRNLTENNPLNPQGYKRVYIVAACINDCRTALDIV